MLDNFTKEKTFKKLFSIHNFEFFLNFYENRPIYLLMNPDGALKNMKKQTLNQHLQEQNMPFTLVVEECSHQFLSKGDVIEVVKELNSETVICDIKNRIAKIKIYNEDTQITRFMANKNMVQVLFSVMNTQQVIDLDLF